MRATSSLASKLAALSLRGRHCLVTGGSGALGSAIAADMARAGARVTLVGRNEPRLRTALSQLPPSPSEPETVEKGSGHRYLVVGEKTGVKDIIAVRFLFPMLCLVSRSQVVAMSFHCFKRVLTRGRPRGRLTSSSTRPASRRPASS